MEKELGRWFSSSVCWFWLDGILVQCTGVASVGVERFVCLSQCVKRHRSMLYEIYIDDLVHLQLLDCVECSIFILCSQ